MTVYVLTHEYSDRSGFSICGVTEEIAVANAWYQANDETNVYEASVSTSPNHWMEGIEGWRQRFWRTKQEAMKAAKEADSAQHS